jgi:hypothetical protein
VNLVEVIRPCFGGSVYWHEGGQRDSRPFQRATTWLFPSSLFMITFVVIAGPRGILTNSMAARVNFHPICEAGHCQ